MRATLATKPTDKHFLIRVGGNVSLITGLWPDAALRRDGNLVHAWPKLHQKQVAPLTLRLIRIGRCHNAVYLLTNVLDSNRLSKQAAGAIYRLRWGVELLFRTLKRTLGYAKPRSKAGRRARIEREWGLITMTIFASLGIDALRRRRRDPRRLSPAAMIHALRDSLLHAANKSPARATAALNRALANAVKDDYHRHRSKRSRHRRITKNTPRPLTLNPPRIRSALPRNENSPRNAAIPSLLSLRRCPLGAADFVIR